MKRQVPRDIKGSRRRPGSRRRFHVTFLRSDGDPGSFYSHEQTLKLAWADAREQARRLHWTNVKVTRCPA
jgi:hypothetical protein